MSDPLTTVLFPGEPAPAARVARVLLRALVPPEEQTPPPWLEADQLTSFHRVFAALRIHGGALLADPVGSGKTWIALAAAARWPGPGPVVAIVPASLRTQWRDTAERTGQTVVLHSHELLSRGKVPSGRPRLVLVDESHHFRTPTTRRYRTLAEWLERAPALLLSATPVVNRLEDLGHQLLLAVPDNALAGRGMASLLEALRAGRPNACLGEILIARGGPAPRVLAEGCRVSAAPVRVERTVEPATDQEIETLAGAVQQLRCSARSSVRALIQGVLLQALASSPGAFTVALRRYRGLLFNARDARAAGRELSRAELRRFTGEDAAQLAMWELLPPSDLAPDLDLADLVPLAPLVERAGAAAARDDDRSSRLRRILGDGRSTLVFSTRRETVNWLRRRLAELRPAWCTGDAAGLGPVSLDRETVLDWFRVRHHRARPDLVVPSVLITTDVTAEGLDLQGAGRVVHYDLPWTSVRVDQREGRLLRRGSPHPSVEVIRFNPPAALERRLGQRQCLNRKRRLPGLVGVGAAGRNLYRWRLDLAALDDGGPASAGVAIVNGPDSAVLLGLALDRPGHPPCISLALLTMDGGAVGDPEEMERRLRLALGTEVAVPWDPGKLGPALRMVRCFARKRLRELSSESWSEAPGRGEVRRLVTRLRALGAAAARHRNQQLLALVERTLRLAGGGLRAGETLRLAGLARLSLGRLLRELPGLPAPRGRPPPPVPRILGMIVFTGGNQ